MESCRCISKKPARESEKIGNTEGVSGIEKGSSDEGGGPRNLIGAVQHNKWT